MAPIGRRAKVRSIARPRATPSTRQNLVRESTSSVASVLSELPRTRTACAQTSPSILFLSFYLSVYPHTFPAFPKHFRREKYEKLRVLICALFSVAPIGLVASAGEDRSPFKRIVPSRLSRARPAFLPSFLAFYRRTTFYMLRLRFVRTSSLCSVNSRFIQ